MLLDKIAKKDWVDRLLRSRARFQQGIRFGGMDDFDVGSCDGGAAYWALLLMSARSTMSIFVYVMKGAGISRGIRRSRGLLKGSDPSPQASIRAIAQIIRKCKWLDLAARTISSDTSHTQMTSFSQPLRQRGSCG